MSPHLCEKYCCCQNKYSLLFFYFGTVAWIRSLRWYMDSNFNFLNIYLAKFRTIFIWIKIPVLSDMNMLQYVLEISDEHGRSIISSSLCSASCLPPSSHILTVKGVCASEKLQCFFAWWQWKNLCWDDALNA